MFMNRTSDKALRDRNNLFGYDGRRVGEGFHSH